jgi:murein DD-endopeptidase MepM/ murein hydrolase activator NlpD
MPAQRQVISDAAIAGAAKSAGFSGDALVKAVAIAMAESGGNIYAHNAVPPDNSYGLWQINMLGAMGPERRKRFGLKSNEELYDPGVNAKVAYAFYKSRGGFADWSTYTGGSYLGYLPRARKAAGNPAEAPSAGGVEQTGLSNPLSWPGAITDFFGLITDPVTWKRVGMFVGGGILLAIGLFMLSGQADRAGQALGMAVDFIPGGKALKGAKAVS